MKARLSGLRVVEIGDLPAGAYAARLFADFGAEVIKVEPSAGDPNRSFPPLINGGSGWFAYLNYGKKSVLADKIDLDALLGGADVLIDSTGTDHLPIRISSPSISPGSANPAPTATSRPAMPSAARSRVSCS